MSKKPLSPAFIILACFSFLFLLAIGLKNKISFQDENLPKGMTKYDFFKELLKQEFNKTKDPRINAIPKERLLTAQQYMKTRLASQRAISGVQWIERGPSNVGGRTRALLFDLSAGPSYNVVFAGGVSGGLWKCNDITAVSPSWIKITDVLDNIAISCLAQDPSNNQIMYAGTGEVWGNLDALRGLGIWKSTDGGTTWTQLSSTNNSSFNYIQKIIVNSSGVVFAATGTGVKKSTDNGTTWTSVLNGNISDIELAANNDIYTASFYGHIYKSTAVSGGASWTDVSPSGAFARVEIATAPSDAQTLYLLCQGAASDDVTGIFQSTNGGSGWTSRSVPTIFDQGANSIFTRSQAWYDLIAAVDPSNANRLYIGGVDDLRSTDGGATFTQMTDWAGNASWATASTTVHADHHAFVFAPGSSSKGIIGCDGGIFYSANLNTSGTTRPDWANKNNGYNITQFYAADIHPTSGNNYLLAGAQDNGTNSINASGIGAATEVYGGDGAFCHISQTTPNTQIAAYVFCNFGLSTNGGASFATKVSDNNGQFINPTDYDDANDILYAGYTAGKYLRWPTTAGAGTSTKSVTVTAMGTTASVSAVRVSPNTADRVYFGLDDGSVVYVDGASTGNGASITIAGTKIKSGTGYVSCIEVQPGNENHILVTYSNYGVQSVFETTNGGTNWTNIENNLPDMPVRWVIFKPGSSTQAFIATELGIWSTDNLNGSSTEWSPTNNGMANTRVDMLKYRTSDNTIVAATHGRGCFTTTLSNPTMPYIHFQTNKINVSETYITSTGCNSGYKDIPVTMMITNPPASDVTVTIGAAGNSTTANSQDYSLSTNTLTFTAGSTTTQSFNVRVYDDAATENTESIVLNYSITGGVGAAQPATTFQTCQLDIADNDPSPNGPYNSDKIIGSWETNLGASSPLQGSFSDKKIQYLYLASELTAAGITAGAINKLTFTINSKASTTAFNNFNVNIGQTVTANLSGDFISPTFTNVYSGNYTSVQGDNSFTVSGFSWDGTSNIVLQFCYDNSTAGNDDILLGQTGTGSFVCQAKNAASSGAGCSLTSTATNIYRPLIILTQPVAATSVETVLSSSYQTKIGPNETVNVFDGSNKILATIQNLTNLDYGCTTVQIDRAVASSVYSQPFWNNNTANYLTSKSIKVVPSQNGSNTSGSYKITLYYTAAEVNGWQTETGNTWNNAQVVKVSNGYYIPDVTPSSIHAADVTITTGTSGTLGTDYSITGTFANASFSGFAAGIPGNALPVTLLKFNGRLDKNKALLYWQSVAELNLSGYEVEKSWTGNDFTKIGFVAPKGSFNNQTSYNFTDNYADKNIQFYRLRMANLDGSGSYSPIIVLHNNNANSFINNVYPTLTSGLLHIVTTNQSGKMAVTIFDAAGKKVYSTITAVMNQMIDVSKLTGGIYHLQITGVENKELSYRTKFVKE
ncbi:MAG: T9SS type A sorting domain-containing protein [Sphingobacteriales bacterium]